MHRVGTPGQAGTVGGVHKLTAFKIVMLIKYGRLAQHTWEINLPRTNKVSFIGIFWLQCPTATDEASFERRGICNITHQTNTWVGLSDQLLYS